MANASVSGTPLSFWYDRRRQIKAGLARERKNLEDFESGRLLMGQRSGDGPWRDVTKQWIENHTRVASGTHTSCCSRRSKMADYRAVCVGGSCCGYGHWAINRSPLRQQWKRDRY